MHERIGLLYLERLGADDVELLADAARRAGHRDVDGARLRSQPHRIVPLLSEPATRDAVFGAAEEVATPSRLVAARATASAFLTFAVAVHRAAAELEDLRFTEEWVGPRRRLPVFDVQVLRDFVADPLRRLFLVELLASYTHVVSGATWERTTRGWRRRRFSELEPAQLAALLDVVPEAERPGVYRRLGDLALFLTGVFPDHTATRGLGPAQRLRLLRVSGVDAGIDDALPADITSLGTVGLLELLGERWYRLAVARTQRPLTATMQVTGAVSEQFRQARRVLNFVTDQFLFPQRGQWFGVA
ncbi:MAG: hypothetical protein JOZ99_13820 [Actinobacteria bacterium]|nr:hypothetical protein [Actinomycetota bacterium]